MRSRPRIVNGRNVNNTSQLCQRKASAAETRALRSGRPNVVLWASTWERTALVVGRGPQRKVVAQGSPQWYATLRERMHQRILQLTASGATVFLLTQPPFVDLGKPTGPTSQDRDFERLNAFLREFAASTPHVKLLDLATLVCPSGPPCPLVVDNVWVRGDGEHYTGVGSLWAARWLMPQLGIQALQNPGNTLPVMKMVAPIDGRTLKGTQAIASVASFNVGLTKVEFQATGNVLRTRTSEPLSPHMASGLCAGTPQTYPTAPTHTKRRVRCRRRRE